MSESVSSTIPVIDLFAGPGGLDEGFCAFRLANGRRPFKIALSIEHDSIAHQTLQLRAFYRQFSSETVPTKYYELLRGNVSIESAFEAYPAQARAVASVSR